MTKATALAAATTFLLLPIVIQTPANANDVGIASFYSDAHHGRRTANGERFDMHALTAAHRSLSFGTKLRVTNLANGQSVVVRINDRGPFIGGRVLDVSKAAARALGFTARGVTRVRMERVGRAA